MRRILVVKLADIGDVLTATPALRALRRAFPHAHITALIPPHCRELLEDSPLVDELLFFDKRLFDSLPAAARPGALWPLAQLAVRLRRARPDALLLLHHLTTPQGAAKYAGLALASGAPIRAGLDNGRGWFLTHRAPDGGFGARHEVEYCNEVVRLLGAEPDFGPLELPLHAEDIAYADQVLPPGAGRPRIAMHPGSGTYSLARRWAAERFVVLAQALEKELGATIVLVGGKEEIGLNRSIAAEIESPVVDMTGRTSLRQLGAVLKACDLFVGNDSGVMHIAAAMGVLVVALFGPSNHRAWGPWTPRDGGQSQSALVIRSELPCSPCFYTGHSLGTPEGCPNRTCLQLITPSQVAKAIARLVATSDSVPLPSGR